MTSSHSPICATSSNASSPARPRPTTSPRCSPGPGKPHKLRPLSTPEGVALRPRLHLELDDGRTVPMKAGDICVQRGTMHAWVAKGSEPAVFAFVLIDAEPVEKGGKS